MTEEKEKVVLKGQEAINLYMQGKDAWNTWVKANPVADVDFSHQAIEANEEEENKKLINFSGFQFPKGDVIFGDATFGEGKVKFYRTTLGDGYVEFDNATFRGEVNFYNVNFGSGEVSFRNTSFRGPVSFYNINFEGATSFYKAYFGNVSSFAGCSFQKMFTLEFSRFNDIPDFTSTKFNYHLNIGNMIVEFPKTERIQLSKEEKKNEKNKKTWLQYYPQRISENRDVVKLRRLKQLAGEAKDHRLELDFFAEELRAKRYHEVKGFRLIPNYLYGWLSDFGRSLSRPIILLGVFWMLFSGLFFLASKELNRNTLENSIRLSSTYVVPFIEKDKRVRKRSMEALYGANSHYDIARTLGILQILISTLLIALFLLALRNRFKIK